MDIIVIFLLFTADGQDSGWYSTSQPIYISTGFKAIFHFGIGDTAISNSPTRTFVGLWGAVISGSIPVFNSTTTIQSFTTQNVGIIQEVGETAWSFYTRGSSSFTKIATGISCTAPSTTWFNLEIYNPPGTNNLILTFVDLGNVTYATQTFVASTAVCGNTVPLYFLCQRSMAIAGGINGSAIMETNGFKLLTC